MIDNQHITIPKQISSEDDLDFSFLKSEGVKYIEQLGRKLWTDFNVHDPGITTLDVLSYAITDLGARMQLDMSDLLASESKPINQQFFKASEILPTEPVTALDYRKLFLDIDPATVFYNGKDTEIRPIRNCWIVPYQESIYVDCKSGNMSFEIEEFGVKDRQQFDVKGLYKILVDFDPRISDSDKNRATEEIYIRYHANRNLCEDLVVVEEIEAHDIAICAKIEVKTNADEEFVNAQVLRCIDKYLTDEVRFYSLQQMLSRGITTDEIFDGPLLKNGFIDTQELEQSNLREEVFLSDLINKIMDIDGIEQISEISLAECGDTEVKPTENWSIPVESGKKPVRCELSSFSYNKGALPLNLNEEKVEQYLQELQEEDIEEFNEANDNNEIEIPEGEDLSLSSHNTIMDDFPENYGVGSNGVITERTTEREALAKQMKSYLLFFDQILANYFSHLSKVKELLSINGDETRTHFAQALEGINGFENLVTGYSATDSALTETLYNELDNNVEKRNQILDHLIARFAERFNEYTFLMKTVYGNAAEEISIKNKQLFLRDYSTTSAERGLAYNYYNKQEVDLWNTSNVSGVQKRIARLLGINDFTRRNVSDSPVILIETTVDSGERIYRWKIQNLEKKILLSSTSFNTFEDSLKNEFSASEELEKVILTTIQITDNELEDRFKLPLQEGDIISNLKITKTSSGKFCIKVIDDLGEIIAGQNKYYATVEELKEAITDLITFLKYEYNEEGIFLVESIAYKPNSINKSCGIDCMIVGDNFVVGKEEGNEEFEGSFMTNCDGDCDEEVSDPYSYRVHIIIPGYSFRFSDPDFREYAETVIRQELPAHILAKICWVSDRRNKITEITEETNPEETEEVETGTLESPIQTVEQNDLLDFETAYKEFLINKSNNKYDPDNLIKALYNLNNYYEPSQLIDCEDDSDELQGKFILGQSNLKTL